MGTPQQALLKAYDEQNSSEVLPPPRKSKPCSDHTTKALPFGEAFLVWLCNNLEDYVVVVSDEISNYEILEMAGV